MPTGLRKYIMHKIQSSFARVNDKIKFVVVSFQDINGVFGGNDKQCKVEVIGDNSVQVYVIDAHSSPKVAFTKALGRVQFSFIDNVKKLANKACKRPLLVAN